MKNNFKAIITSLILLSAFVLGGCNTAAGFGKDLEKGGQELQKAAAQAADNGDNVNNNTKNNQK